MSLMSFRDALVLLAGETPNVLLGNGFSLALDRRFSYDALFEMADFGDRRRVKSAFNALDTTDFETVMKVLRSAAKLLKVYPDCSSNVVRQLTQDADNLREVLVAAIADNHLSHPSEIDEARYKSCRTFLNRFSAIYTLNYDLLLYWALMQDEIEPKELTSDDGFRKPREGKQEYVTWEPGRYSQRSTISTAPFTCSTRRPRSRSSPGWGPAFR